MTAPTRPTYTGDHYLAPEVAGTLRSRLAYLDVFRVGLTILVVLHHVAMSYGAAGLGFYFVDLPPEGISRNLLMFVLTNQAWFMGAFFLIAGYFTPASFDRRGAARFTRSRVVRLGVPLAVYALVLNPVAATGWFHMPEFLSPMTWETFSYMDSVRMGPAWFLALLLVFSAIYAGWRLIARKPTDHAGGRIPGFLTIGLFVIALAGVSFFLRMHIEVGEEFWGFPSLAYLPQYLSFFVIGTIAARRDWLRSLTAIRGTAGFAAAAAAIIFLYPLAFSGEMFSLKLTESLSLAFGGGTWRSAVYALWDSMLAVGLILGTTVALRVVVKAQGAFGRFLAQQSYAVYLIHVPIVVYVAVALRDVEIARNSKILIGALIAAVASWGLAWLIRRIPGVRRVV